MFKKIGMFLLVLLVVLVVGGFVFPSDYALARSIEIEGTPDQVHALVGDLKRWDEWTPFKDNDPTVNVTLGDKTQGVGAHQAWTDESGGGELTFTDSSPTEGVAYDMQIGDMGTSASTIKYEVIEGGKTKVTWSMNGEIDVPVLGPYIVMKMKGPIHQIYDQGLAKLKSAVEKE